MNDENEKTAEVPEIQPELQLDEVRREIRRTYGCIALFVVLVIFLVTLWAMTSGPIFLNRQRDEIEANLKVKLSYVGSSQLAYSRRTDTGKFGEFRDMLDSGFLPIDSNPNNIIPGYFLTWNTGSYITGTREVHTFTIIAYPQEDRPGFLRTFALTEDMTVRIFSPENGNDFYRVKTWDPAM
ncbi:MAG TPA: hypothetical protein ENN67_07215 [Firmicutes bacterium]|nr:hypothetical protein [Bacillota bacterium]